MFKAVTFLGFGVLILAGCGGKPGAGAPRCTVAAASAETLAIDAEVAAWQARLPRVFKYDFERSADRAIMALPVCVKSADQLPDRAKYVTSEGVWPTEAIALKYEYFFTPKRTRAMDLKLKRDGDAWSGTQFEDTLLGSFLRSGELELPTCTAARLAAPDEVRFVAKGRVTKVVALTDAPGTLACH